MNNAAHTLEDIYVTDSVTLSGKKQYSVKIYPWMKPVSVFGNGIFMNTDYLKESIQTPLKNWCDETFVGEYDLLFRFNDADPYWVLLCERGEDFSVFMLRYNHLNKN